MLLIIGENIIEALFTVLKTIPRRYRKENIKRMPFERFSSERQSPKSERESYPFDRNSYFCGYRYFSDNNVDKDRSTVGNYRLCNRKKSRFPFNKLPRSSILEKYTKSNCTRDRLCSRNSDVGITWPDKYIGEGKIYSWDDWKRTGKPRYREQRNSRLHIYRCG